MQIGDLQEVEKRLQQMDMLIANYHGERLVHKYQWHIHGMKKEQVSLEDVAKPLLRI